MLELQRRSLLITGGAGFIGSHLVQIALDSGYNRIVVLDLLTYAGFEVNLDNARSDSRFTFVHGDIRDTQLIQRLVMDYGIDCVLHLAAESHVDRSIEQARLFEDVNVRGTLSVLEAIQLFPHVRLVYVSTDEVYGDAFPDSVFSESVAFHPSSPYSASKAAADGFVQAFIRTYSIDAVILRPTNNYGPRQLPEKFIPRMIQHALTGSPLPVYGDGTNQRDWLHVSDCCRAILAVMEQGCRGNVFNVSAQSVSTNREVAMTILHECGAPDNYIEYVVDRPGHDRRYALNCDKIRNEVGWRPLIPFEIGLKDTIEWYRKNGDWCSIVLGDRSPTTLGIDNQTTL